MSLQSDPPNRERILGINLLLYKVIAKSGNVTGFNRKKIPDGVVKMRADCLLYLPVKQASLTLR